MTPASLPSPPKLLIVAAFAATYLIWGSTYLAIRIAIETIPPFLMAGLRFFLAGLIVYSWGRLRGGVPPSRGHWPGLFLIGTLLLAGGGGGVVWAEQYVPSGITALLVATVPFWMVLIDWLRPGGVRPPLATWAGLLVGFAGVGLLVDPSSPSGTIPWPAFLALLVSSLSWSFGSFLGRSLRLPDSALISTGSQMLCGAAVLTVMGTFSGEWSQVHLSAISSASLLSLAYLVIFGSVVAFSAYVWLLRVTTPAKAATYAFVNPAVAVFLGWLLAGEAMSWQVLEATVLIVFAVCLVSIGRRFRTGAATDDPSARKLDGAVVSASSD